MVVSSHLHKRLEYVAVILREKVKRHKILNVAFASFAQSDRQPDVTM